MTLVIGIYSCKKDNPGLVFSSKTFPNDIGDHWRYKYTYNGQNNSYIDVDIINQKTLPNGQSALVWVYKILSNTDTVLVTSNNDSTIIYENFCSTCPNPTLYVRMKYFFPLQTGNIWFGDFIWGDTTKVLNNNSLTVPAGTYTNTFELSKKIGYVVNSVTKNEIWFTPNVGLTKLNQYELNLGPVLGNGLWELDNYLVK